MARRGEVVVSNDVYRSVCTAVDVEALSPLRLKGFEAHVPAHRVTGLRRDS